MSLAAHHRSVFAGVVIALALGAAACGGSGSGAQSEHVDFAAPPLVGGAKHLATPAAATGLPFRLVAPASLGRPDVYITDPPREAALVYRDPVLGTYWVEERVSSLTVRDLKALAACPSVAAGCGDPGWRLTALPDGTPAIEIGTPPDTAVLFLHDGVRFDVLGPPGAFTERDALAAAGRIELAAR